MIWRKGIDLVHAVYPGYFTGKTDTAASCLTGTDERNEKGHARGTASAEQTGLDQLSSGKLVPQLTVIWKKVSSFLATFDAETA